MVKTKIRKDIKNRSTQEKILFSLLIARNLEIEKLRRETKLLKIKIMEISKYKDARNFKNLITCKNSRCVKSEENKVIYYWKCPKCKIIRTYKPLKTRFRGNTRIKCFNCKKRYLAKSNIIGKKGRVET